MKKNVERKRTGDYHTNPPHGQFERATKQDWLRKGVLMKETEGLITSCPGSDVKNNSIGKRIDGEDLSSLCRICREREETISHIVTEFKKLAQKEYKGWRND